MPNSFLTLTIYYVVVYYIAGQHGTSKPINFNFKGLLITPLGIVGEGRYPFLIFLRVSNLRAYKSNVVRRTEDVSARIKVVSVKEIT